MRPEEVDGETFEHVRCASAHIPAFGFGYRLHVSPALVLAITWDIVSAWKQIGGKKGRRKEHPSRSVLGFFCRVGFVACSPGKRGKRSEDTETRRKTTGHDMWVCYVGLGVGACCRDVFLCRDFGFAVVAFKAKKKKEARSKYHEHP